MRAAFETLESRRLPAVTLVVDYSLDTSGFLASPERRAVVEEAAAMLSLRLGDTLAAIVPSAGNTWRLQLNHPATGQTHTLSNPTLPAGVIPIYVGGRPMPEGTLAVGGQAGFQASGSATWLDLIRGRGQPGAIGMSDTLTDVGVKAGSVSFNTAKTWHFGRQDSPPTPGTNDLLSVALHEMVHVLGLAAGNPSWMNRIVGGAFTGPAAVALFGSPVPMADDSHFAEGTLSPGVGEAAMDPTLTVGTRKLLTPLDWAALDDIGWEVLPDAAVDAPTAVISAGDFTVVEGGSLTLSAGDSSIPSPQFIVGYEWDTDFNGTFVPRATGLTVQLSFTDADGPGQRRVALRVLGSGGGASVTSVTLTVVNAAPSGQLLVGLENGRQVARVVDAFDVPADLPGLIYRFDLDDDGRWEQQGLNPAFTLPLATPGSPTERPLRVTVGDKDGGTRSFLTTVTLTPDLRPLVLHADPTNPRRQIAYVRGTDAADLLQLSRFRGQTFLTLNGQRLAPVTSRWSRVLAWLGGGDDVVRLGGLNIPLWADGGDGNDTLQGGSARDVLLGGRGADLLRGGAGEDLLAAGSYAISVDRADELLRAWAGRGTLLARTLLLADNPGSPFSAAEVADDEPDELRGEAGNDLFLAAPNDVIPGLGRRELLRAR